MLKPLQHGSEVELMREFANPMPVRIISEMLGVPQELHDTFVNWSRAIAVFRGNPESHGRAGAGGARCAHCH